MNSYIYRGSDCSICALPIRSKVRFTGLSLGSDFSICSDPFVFQNPRKFYISYFKDGLWFLHIPFGHVLISCTIVCDSTFLPIRASLFCYFASLTYFVINRFISVTTKPNLAILDIIGTSDIIIIIILLLWESFTPALAEGFSQEFEW